MATSIIEDSASDQNDNKIFFAAIDIGTSFSGWAFASRSDLGRNANIYVKPSYCIYNSGSTGKTSTCALIMPDGKTLDSFGFEAERKYEELVSKKKHEPYYFFKTFKTGLYGKNYQPLKSWLKQGNKLNKGQHRSRSAKLLDQTGKDLPAINVFAVIIRFLAEGMYTDVQKRIQNISQEDIKWVITVPAIWTDQAKYLRRESAILAGLPSNSNIIALEPEAASIYCRQLEVCAVNRQSGVTLSSLEIGSKYLVLDAGGGTIDLTIHEIASSECVKQVVAATGNIYGGNEVNKAFENYLRTALSVEKYKFKQKETEDWLELMGDFETKKKAFDLKQNTVNIRCPRGLHKIYKSSTRNSFFKKLKRTKGLEEAFRGLSLDVTLNRDKIIFPSRVFSMMFQPAIDKAIKEIKKVIREVYGETISCILMVGGFSECILLQQAVMSEFPHIPVVVPVEAATTVLKCGPLWIPSSRYFRKSCKIYIRRVLL